MSWNHQLDINQHPTHWSSINMFFARKNLLGCVQSWSVLTMLGASVEGCLSIGIGHLVGQWFLWMWFCCKGVGWVVYGAKKAMSLCFKSMRLINLDKIENLSMFKQCYIRYLSFLKLFLPTLKKGAILFCRKPRMGTPSITKPPPSWWLKTQGALPTGFASNPLLHPR